MPSLFPLVYIILGHYNIVLSIIIITIIIIIIIVIIIMIIIIVMIIIIIFSISPYVNNVFLF